MSYLPFELFLCLLKFDFQFGQVEESSCISNRTLSTQTESIQGTGFVGVMCSVVSDGTFLCNERELIEW